MTQEEVRKAYWNQIWVNTDNVVKNIVDALPMAILFGGIALVLMICFERFGTNNKKISIQRKCAGTILMFYGELLFQLAVVSRPIGSVEREVVFVPFRMPGGFHLITFYAIANVVAFIPFGIMVPLVWDKWNRVRYCALLGLVVSCSFEAFQFFLQCGVTQTEDVITNTMGSALGCAILQKLLKRHSRGEKHESTE